VSRRTTRTRWPEISRIGGRSGMACGVVARSLVMLPFCYLSPT
jgi:hypothetical protein